MMNRKKKNLTILLLAVLNFILTIFAITNLKSMVPINIFKSDIGKMCSKQMLLAIPLLVIVISLIQVFYRLKTMDKPVTTGKLIEDGTFAFVDGLLICINWLLVYISSIYTKTTLINVEIPVIYIVMGIIGLVMAGIYSTYPINKKGSILGLRTKETLEDDGVWRISNRFNGFTGFVSSIIVVLLAAYYIVCGFNFVYLLLAIIFCGMLMFYVPRLHATMIARKKSKKTIE